MTRELAGPAFEVLDGGLLTTVQDLGRPGHVHEGVPRAGAADGLSLAVANALAGNPAGAAALEVTIGGLRLRVLQTVTVGLAGADLGASVTSGPRTATDGPQRRLDPGRTHVLHAGDDLSFEGRAGDGLGCRAYLAVPGGFDVPEVLGSRSTSLVGSFGGFEGRALRAGDVLPAGRSGAGSGARSDPAPGVRPGAASGAGSAVETPMGRRAGRLPAGLDLPSPAQRLRIIASALDEQGRSAAEHLARQAWVVGGDSDRRGLRLLPASRGVVHGAPGVVAPGPAPAPTADQPSEPVVPGTIQLTPSGQPLVLMPDAGTTGGYAVSAIVIAADLPILGQLAPWDEVRFRLVDVATAVAAARDRHRLLDALVAALAPDAAGDRADRTP